MKYSYSPTAGFQATPGHSRVVSLGQPPPRPQYTPPPAQYPASPPQSPPAASPTASASFYGNFAGSQQPPNAPPAYRPALPPRQSQPTPPTQKSPTGYTPVAFDSPHPSGLTPEQFYGSLIDASGRPTQIFSRMSDASFFWLDQSCDIPGLRGTGVVEPAKYGWLMGKLGSTPEECQLVQQYLASFYTTASIPFRYVQTPQGQIPVVDRRGWLHLAVYEARATPQEAFETWTKSLARFPLADPATGAPFPTPFPRGALPAVADPNLYASYLGWRTQTVAAISRQRTEAMIQNIVGASSPSYSFNPYAAGALGAGAGAGAVGASAFGGAPPAPASTSGESGGGTSVLETVNNVATLANTVLGAFGVGGGAGAGGAGAGGSAAQLGATALGALGGNAFGAGYGTGFGTTGYGF